MLSVRATSDAVVVVVVVEFRLKTIPVSLVQVYSIANKFTGGIDV